MTEVVPRLAEAEAVVQDLVEAHSMTDGARGLIAGFGSGITAEIGVGRWNADPHPDEKLSATFVRPLRGRPRRRRVRPC
ncbi:hypothetical protein ACFWWA_38645 [Streptomyces goshikiensis]|uniref:hypothetical protein n=1 Tax=Streptomyces goshikiensis TaxID=1942 RepID=UPI0036504969